MRCNGCIFKEICVYDMGPSIVTRPPRGSGVLHKCYWGIIVCDQMFRFWLPISFDLSLVQLNFQHLLGSFQPSLCHSCPLLRSTTRYVSHPSKSSSTYPFSFSLEDHVTIGFFMRCLQVLEKKMYSRVYLCPLFLQ